MPKSFSAELGAWKASVERRLDNLSSGNRLDHASLDGTTLYLKGDGELGRIGRQPDGSNGVHVVKVQPPPQLTAPFLTVGEQAGTCLVEWDGGTFDGRRMPLIHGHTEIWAELVGEDWSPTVAPGDTAKRVGTIRDRTGGEVVVALPQAGTWAVWLRAMGADRETAGPWSPVSQVEIVPLVDTSEWEEKLEIERDRITEADERLTFGQDVLDGKLEFLDTERLPTIESTLSEKAASSELDQLSTLLAGRERVYTGEGEPDDSTAARGITYEWAGTPHASESIKRVDGVEVARNLATNPELDNDTYAWTAFGASMGVTTAHPQMWGRGPGPILEATANGTSTFSVRHDPVPLAGRWLSAHMLVATDRQLEVSDQTWFYDADGNNVSVNFGRYRSAPWYDGAELHYAVEAPEGAVSAEVRLYGRPTAAGDRLWVDRTMIISAAATEADALAQASEYFDGDTEDVLDAPATEGTIYYQTDGDVIVAIWRRTASDWTKLPLRDEVFSSISVGKLVAGDAAINEAVISKLWAELGVFDRLDAREGWIGGVALQDSAVTSRSVDTEEFFAAMAVIEEIWTNIVRAKMIETQGFITEDMIATGAITTPKLTVTEEMVGEVARLLRIEAGSLASNDIEAMRIVSSLIEATTYLIHNADGGVSVRLDGLDNYIAGRLHAGMSEQAGISLDYRLAEVPDDWADEDDEGSEGGTSQFVTPEAEFHSSHTHELQPKIFVNADGALAIDPGKFAGQTRRLLQVFRGVRTQRVESVRYQVQTNNANYPGGLMRDGDRMRIYGRAPDWSHPWGTFTVGQLGPYNPSTGNYRGSIGFSAPAETGTRMPTTSGRMSQGSVQDWRSCTATVGGVTASGFYFSLVSESTSTNMWVIYNAIWQ